MPSQTPPTQDTMKTTPWIQRQGTPTETWERRDKGGKIIAYVSKYAGSDGFNWQAIRGAGHRSESALTREAAMTCADAALAMPIDEFNAAAVAELWEDIQELEQKILALCPGTPLLPGYQAGYAAGLVEARRRVNEALAPEAK